MSRRVDREKKKSKQRYSKVCFPINLQVVVNGKEQTKSIHVGDEYYCLKCGQRIYANRGSVFVVDDLPYVTCTNVISVDKETGKKHRCGYKVFGLYYIEQKEKESWKQKEKKH